MLTLAILLLVTGGECYVEIWEIAVKGHMKFPNSVGRGQIKLPDTEETTPPPTAAPLDAELDSPGIIAFFNDFRSSIAKGVFADGSPTNLAQSDGLFKILDDPTLAKYAAAEAGDAVDARLPAEYSRAVYSTQLTYASDTTFVRKALDVWYRYAIGVLPADNATYLQRDVATLDGYAQAVYYKSVRSSCVIRRNIFSTPSGKKGTILACVFNSRPVVGQTLYPVKRSPAQGKGCTMDCSCQYYSGRNGSKCSTASGLCIAGTGSTFSYGMGKVDEVWMLRRTML